MPLTSIDPRVLAHSVIAGGAPAAATSRLPDSSASFIAAPPLTWIHSISGAGSPASVTAASISFCCLATIIGR